MIRVAIIGASGYTGAESIRDVILYPQLRPENPVAGA